MKASFLGMKVETSSFLLGSVIVSAILLVSGALIDKTNGFVGAVLCIGGATLLVTSIIGIVNAINGE